MLCKYFINTHLLNRSMKIIQKTANFIFFFLVKPIILLPLHCYFDHNGYKSCFRFWLKYISNLQSLSRDNTEPQSANNISNANEQTSLRQSNSCPMLIKLLPNATIHRNNAEAIWLMSTKSMYCLNNLQQDSL